MSHPITTQFDQRNTRGELGGWYDGKQTYLWFGIKDGECLGTVSDQRLYRLAKAIVRQFEDDKRGGK